MSDNNRLAGYLPAFMREIREIYCILKAQSERFDDIEKAVKRGLDCSFAAFADDFEGGLDRWERLFGIAVKAGECMQSRRQEVLSRLSDRLPYTRNTLDAVLTALYGNDGNPRHSLEIDCRGFTVTVSLDLALEDSLPVIERFLRRRIPANMEIAIVFVFQKHKDLVKYTHSQLGAYTHMKIKRGEFN